MVKEESIKASGRVSGTNINYAVKRARKFLYTHKRQLFFLISPLEPKGEIAAQLVIKAEEVANEEIMTFAKLEEKYCGDTFLLTCQLFFWGGGL